MPWVRVIVEDVHLNARWTHTPGGNVDTVSDSSQSGSNDSLMTGFNQLITHPPRITAEDWLTPWQRMTPEERAFDDCKNTLIRFKVLQRVWTDCTVRMADPPAMNYVTPEADEARERIGGYINLMEEHGFVGFNMGWPDVYRVTP